jgi:MFS family permease
MTGTTQSAFPASLRSEGFKTSRAAWLALILISLTQAMSMVDRQILAILVPRIKADLHVGDAEMGLLYGTVFALFYALFSLPLGRLADGWKRTRLLSLSIAGWSVMTALAGFANGFGVLALSRLGVGIGEASVQPAGMSLLSDRFPKKQRGTVTAALAAAIALGLGGALWIGGATADAWDQAYAAGGAPLGIKGWQAAFLIASLPGILLAILLWRMEEPVRGAADGIAEVPDPKPFRAARETLASILPGLNWLSLYRNRAGAGTWWVNLGGLVTIVIAMIGLTRWTDALRKVAPPPLNLGGLVIGGNALQFVVTGFGIYVVLNWLQSLRLRDKPAYAIIAKTPALTLLFVIAALQSVVNYGVMAWSPSFIIKTYGISPAKVGLEFGALVAGIGIIGPLIAGPLSDWMQQRVRGGRIYVTLASLVVSPVLAFFTYRAPTLGVFYLWFTVYSLALTMWLPSIYASFMDLVLPRMRGSVISFYILTMTIVGLGTGPYAVGLVSDVNGGNLGEAILSVYWLAPVLIVLIVWLIRQLPRDEATVVERARAAGEAV